MISFAKHCIVELLLSPQATHICTTGTAADCISQNSATEQQLLLHFVKDIFLSR